MSFLWSLLAFVLMLGIIIMIHECGHFMAAKAFGVHVHEFALGMGPILFKKQGKETLYTIRALPIGGYVMMAGENDGSVDEEEEDNWLKDVPQDKRLNNKPRWQQIIVMIAGVVMNFLLAAVLFVGLAMARGTVTESPLPVVEEVVENMPAANAGLQKGDRIIRAMSSDGQVLTPKTQDDLVEFIQYNPGESLFTIDRDGEEINVHMEPVKDEDGIYRLGFTSLANVRKIGSIEAIGVGLQDMWNSAGSIFRSLGMLVQGKGLEGLSGPIGIYKVTDQVVSYGLSAYLALFALISLNIGIFNLIPIPALDGGRILILLLEGLFRRKIPTKWVEGVIVASFVLLIGIMILATYNDITRYFF